MTRIPFFSFFFVDGVTFRLCWGKPVCTEIGPYVVGSLFQQPISKSSLFFQKIKSACAKEEGREEKVDLNYPTYNYPRKSSQQNASSIFECIRQRARE